MKLSLKERLQNLKLVASLATFLKNLAPSTASLQ